MKIHLKSSLILVAILIVTILGTSLVSAAPDAQLEQPVLIVNSEALNVRSGPGMEFPALFRVPHGTPLPVIAQIGDGVWFHVATISGPGWVNAMLTSVRGTLSNAPIVPRPVLQPPPPPPIPGAPVAPGVVGTTAQFAGIEAVVNSARLNIRSGAGIQYGILTSVSGGTRLTVVGRAPDGIWILVDGVFGRGWVNSTLTVVRGDLGLLPIVDATFLITGTAATLASVEAVVNAATLNVRSGAGIQYSILTSVIGGTTLRVVGIAEDGVWILVEGTFGRGWINRTLTLVRGDVSILPVISDTFGGVIPAPATPEAVINTGRLNIRFGPGIQWAVVTSLPGGARVDVIGRADDNVWLLVEGVFGRGWVNRNFVLVRGDVSLLPIFAA